MRLDSTVGPPEPAPCGPKVVAGWSLNWGQDGPGLGLVYVQFEAQPSPTIMLCFAELLALKCSYFLLILGLRLAQI